MNLTEEQMAHAKELMVEILSYVDNLCKKNNITYSIYYGSLIGAIRHNGFIPWDDDLDICMKRDDYNRFKKIVLKDQNNKYFFQDWDTDAGYGHCFGKLMLKDTKWIVKGTELTQRKYCGIYIDIFPLDKMAKNKKEIERNKKFFFLIDNCIHKKCKYNQFVDNSIANRKSRTIINVITFLGTKKTLFFIRNWIMKKYSNLESEYLLVDYSEFKLYDPILFEETIPHEFEGKNFDIPKKYDQLLTQLYGDYMKLPPETERVNHGVEYFEF